MSLLGPNTDYTDKDFDSLRARLINLVRSAFPDWTDFNVANFGNILLELFAYTGDVLVFYQDNQSQESRISTAQLRRSLIGLGKLIGFEPSGGSASTATLTLTLSEPPTGSVTIDPGDLFSTLEITDPVVFQALTGATIPALADPPTAIFTVENSQNASQSFSSNSLPNQEYQLSETPYLEGSAVVSAANGAYTEVDNFLDSISTDRHFTTTVDENDRVTIRFGNGINGEIPSGVIAIDYKTGGGAQGNVEPNAIRKALKSYTDSFGSPVQIASLANVDAASGGSPRQSIASIKEQAPESLRVLNRTVAREDYEINAEAVAGVARALMLTSNERPSIPENQGELHVIPEGGGVPTQTLKDAVLAQVTVTFPNTLTFVVTVVDPVYLTVNVQATVFLSPGQVAATVDARIRANLATFFAITNEDGSRNESIDFGANLLDADGNPTGEIAFSDVYNVVRDTTGVRKIGDTLGSFLLSGEPSDLTIDVFEFPQLGTVTLINGDTGAALA